MALKFKMFREVAKVKEQQALRELKKIKPKNLGEYRSGFVHTIYVLHCRCTMTFLAPGHPETVKNLKNVFEGLKAAAKFYSQVSDILVIYERLHDVRTLSLSYYWSDVTVRSMCTIEYYIHDHSSWLGCVHSALLYVSRICIIYYVYLKWAAYVDHFGCNVCPYSTRYIAVVEVMYNHVGLLIVFTGELPCKC